MSVKLARPAVTVREAVIPDGLSVRIAEPPAGTSAAAIVQALGLQTNRQVILVMGGANSFDRDVPPGDARRGRLRQLFGRGIARAAGDAGAVVVDGGTDAGVMAVLGEAVREQPEKLDLVGVAPRGKVFIPGDPTESSSDSTALEPNHSHIVLVDTDAWGGETATLFAVTAELAGMQPVVVVLVHGGEVSQDELVRSVRLGWPIVVVEGFGGFADQISDHLAARTGASLDSGLDMVLEDGWLIPFPTTERPAALGRLIGRQLGNDETIRDALEQRALYAFNARQQRNRYVWVQRMILILAVIGPLLALAQREMESPSLELVHFRALVPAGIHIDPITPDFSDRLKFPIAAVPFLTLALFLISVQITPGASWFALRYCAEAVRSEVFRYRTRTGVYSDQKTKVTSREQKLAKKLEEINQHLLSTAVTKASLRPAPAGVNTMDSKGILTPAGYIRERLENQRHYYNRETPKLHRALYVYRGFTISALVIGIALAVYGLEMWIALTTAFTVALAAHMQYGSVEPKMESYNRAATELQNVATWWWALTAAEQRDRRNFDRLVASTEAILLAENFTWRQQMEEALKNLLQR